MERYYLGVDWADKFHQVWVSDTQGQKVAEKKVVENVEGLTEFSRWLNESRAQGTSFGRLSRSRRVALWTFSWIMR